jgi:hypothetical protein
VWMRHVRTNASYVRADGFLLARTAKTVRG